MSHCQLILDDVTVCYGRYPAVHHVSCALPLDGLVAVVRIKARCGAQVSRRKTSCMTRQKSQGMQ